MKSNFWILSSMICFVFVSPLLGQQLVKRVGEVKYISQQSYYLNLGTKQGLKAGDILNVRRNGRLIGRLIGFYNRNCLHGKNGEKNFLYTSLLGPGLSWVWISRQGKDRYLLESAYEDM